jgi:hypothetical protein
MKIIELNEDLTLKNESLAKENKVSSKQDGI